MSLPRHRKPTHAEVVTDLRERLDILRRKAAAVSEAWDLFIEDDASMDIVVDAIGSLRVELRTTEDHDPTDSDHEHVFRCQDCGEIRA